MISPFNSDQRLDEYDVTPEADREISLGTSTILGIFFALALVCAVFFGFGYTMGRRSAQPATPPLANLAPPTPSSAATPKPSGEFTDQSNPGQSNSGQSSSDQSLSSPTPPPARASKSSATVPADTPRPIANQVAKPVAAQPAPVAKPAVAAPAPGTAPIMVQIAAVSHKEDAATLVSALQRRGYDVAIRQSPQDKLLHVQVGPFANRKDADAMRLRLLADGYNAIVK